MSDVPNMFSTMATSVSKFSDDFLLKLISDISSEEAKLHEADLCLIISSLLMSETPAANRKDIYLSKFAPKQTI